VVGDRVVGRCRLGSGSCTSCCAGAGVSAVPVWLPLAGAGARGGWAEKTGPEKRSASWGGASEGNASQEKRPSGNVEVGGSVSSPSDPRCSS
jgi:hypothetical protein